MNALLSFNVIMHEKPSNHIDINFKFLHLGLQYAGFPYWEGGWVDLSYPKYCLMTHVNPVLSPKLEFVIFMQLLAILAGS